MSKRKKNSNAITILQHVSANMSLMFAISSMFLPRKRRLKTSEIRKYLKNGRIEYTAYEDDLIKINIYNTVLTQSHLDILSCLVKDTKYDKNNSMYIAQTSLYSLSKKLKIEKRDVKNLIVDLKNVAVHVVVKDTDKEFLFNIIRNIEHKKEDGTIIFFDNSFILYFFFLIPSLRLSEEKQKIILCNLANGESKALARYCISQEHVNQNIFTIPCFSMKDVNDKRIRNKIRKAIRTDINELEKLKIFIDNDNVSYKKEKEKEIKFFINNNNEVISIINTLINANAKIRASIK